MGSELVLQGDGGWGGLEGGGRSRSGWLCRSMPFNSLPAYLFRLAHGHCPFPGVQSEWKKRQAALEASNSQLTADLAQATKELAAVKVCACRPVPIRSCCDVG